MDNSSPYIPDCRVPCRSGGKCQVPEERAVIRSSIKDPALTLPTQREAGLQPFEEMVVRGTNKDRDDDASELDASERRHRGPLDACVLPRTPFRALEAGTKGCIALCFSKSSLAGQGGILAAACAGRERHMINIYTVSLSPCSRTTAAV